MILQQRTFEHDGLHFSYLDSGGNRQPLVILHAHWMSSRDFEEIGEKLAKDYRILALDQRGFGDTSHDRHLTAEKYIGDVAAMLEHARVKVPVVILGHSFGGEVAYLFAAAHKRKVRALIIEEMNVVRYDYDDFVLNWAGTYPTKEALEEKIGPRLSPYLQKSMRHGAQGWWLAFEPEEVLLSEQALNGDHWKEWLATDCPALIIRAQQSKVVPGDELIEMANRRPNTRLVTIDAGHSVHIDAPEEFMREVRSFLAALERSQSSSAHA